MYNIRSWLHIGKLSETYDRRLLQEENIGAMLQIAQAVEQPGIVSLYLPVEDGQPVPDAVLQKGVVFVQEQNAAGKATLIACGLGISRSATFAVAAIKEAEGIGLLEAFHKVKQRHPEARPHPVLWQSLCRYYGEDIPYLKLLRLPPPE